MSRYPIEEINRRKKKICELRLDGLTITEISEQVGISRQSVDRALKKLTKGIDVGKLSKGEDIDKERAMKLCGLMIMGVHFKDAMRTLDMKESEGKAILNRMCTRFPGKREKIKTYYPEVEEWLRMNEWTVMDLSRATGIGSITINHYLKGYKHMPVKAAQKIKEITGITIETMIGPEVVAEWEDQYVNKKETEEPKIKTEQDKEEALAKLNHFLTP